MHGISNPIDAGAKTELPHRFNQEFAEFLGPFVIPPVADPDQVAVHFQGISGTEDANVRRLMPGPHATRPAALDITFADGASIRQHAVIMTEIVKTYRSGIGYAAMMRIVKEQLVSTRCGTMFPNPGH